MLRDGRDQDAERQRIQLRGMRLLPAEIRRNRGCQVSLASRQEIWRRRLALTNGKNPSGGGDTYLAFTSKLAVTLKSPNVDNFAFREPPQPRRQAASPHGDGPGWQLLPPGLHDGDQPAWQTETWQLDHLICLSCSVKAPRIGQLRIPRPHN